MNLKNCFLAIVSHCRDYCWYLVL